jgi:hypothetical protein
MNTIHIELPGIEAKLDRIIELLEKQTTHNCESCVNTATRYVAEALQGTQEAAPVTEDAPEAPAPWEPDPSPFPDQPAIKHADVQKKVVELSAAGKKAEVKEIVTAYAKNVSGIPEDKLAEVWAKLTGLEG